MKPNTTLPLTEPTMPNNTNLVPSPNYLVNGQKTSVFAIIFLAHELEPKQCRSLGETLERAFSALAQHDYEVKHYINAP